MVILHVKKTEDLQFLTQIPADTPNSQVIEHVMGIWNRVIKMRRLADGCEDLAKHGVAKPADQQGLDQYQEGITGKAQPPRGPYYNADPTGKRTGEAPEPKLAEVIMKQVAEVRSVCNIKDRVARKEMMSSTELQEAQDSLRGAVTMAFPQGLPNYDEVDAMFDDEYEKDTRTAEVIDADKAALWWANKQLTRDKKLSDFVGKNDKTKIVVKVTQDGAGAPVREPAVDAQTQKEMMAFYHKRQEELKKLEEEQDDAYLNSSWANPKALKSALHGTGDVKWR